MQELKGWTITENILDLIILQGEKSGTFVKYPWGVKEFLFTNPPKYCDSFFIILFDKHIIPVLISIIIELC